MATTWSDTSNSSSSFKLTHKASWELLSLFFDLKGILEIIIIIIMIIIVDPLGVLEIIIIIIIVVNTESMLEWQCYSSSLDADSNYREVNSNNITQ